MQTTRCYCALCLQNITWWGIATSPSILTGLALPMLVDGELASEWRKWRKKFEIYLKATRQAGENTPSDVKK